MSAQKKSQPIHARILLLLLAIAAFLAFIPQAPVHTLRQPWLPSSFNPGNAGFLALFDTLQESNWPVMRWQDPLSSLTGTDQVWIFARSKKAYSFPYTPREGELLLTWIGRGNTAILAGPLADSEDSRALLQSLGIAVEKPVDVEISLLPETPLAPANLNIVNSTALNPVDVPILTKDTAPISALFPPQAIVLWTLNNAPYVVKIPFQNGQVYWLASPSLLTRGSLAQGQNLEALLSILSPGSHRPQAIYFDELHNGFSTAPNLKALLEDPGIPFAALLTLLGLLTIISSSFVRFGQILPLPGTDASTSTLEMIDSVAELYRKSKLRNEVIRDLYLDTKRRLIQRFKLDPNAPLEIIHAQFSESFPDAPSWKKLAQRFEPTQFNQGLPPSGWVRISRELISIKILIS